MCLCYGYYILSVLCVCMLFHVQGCLFLWGGYGGGRCCFPSRKTAGLTCWFLPVPSKPRPQFPSVAPKSLQCDCQWRKSKYPPHTICCCVLTRRNLFWSGWNFPAWCSGGRRPLIARCSSLQRLGMDLPVTRPVWYSKPGPPASESRS